MLLSEGTVLTVTSPHNETFKVKVGPRDPATGLFRVAGETGATEWMPVDSYFHCWAPGFKRTPLTVRTKKKTKKKTIYIQVSKDQTLSWSPDDHRHG